MSLKADAKTFPAAFALTRPGGMIDSGVRVLAAPVNLALPTIEGLPYIGQTLTANPGAWSGYPSPAFAYVWKKNGVANGTTTSTYAPVSGDIGAVLTVTVSATNSQGGPISATSAGTAAITAGPPITGSLAAAEAGDVFAGAGSLTALTAPVNTAAPTVTGSPNVGATLTASSGSWTGHPAPTYAYVWKRAGSAISGATASTYQLVSADEGNTITVTVTGTNTQGSASATSAATASVTIAPSAPVNTVAPSISGTASRGSVLTASPGTWSGYPAPTYAYQWKRAGTDISGATGSTYTPVTADQGSAITVAVTATNGSGSASATSAATGAVVGSPANTVAPTVSGSANVGSTLTATTGTWTGYPAPTYTYQWYWFDTVTPISGATSSTYVPVSGDVGHTISVNVTATNASGAVSASSSATAAVTATPPSYLAIFAGQSNMSAEGAGGAPAGFSSDSGIKIWNATAGTFDTYAPGTNSMGQTTGTQYWGPEVAFAMKFRADNPSTTLYIVKHAVGGTPLGASSDPTWKPSVSGSLYDQLKTKVNNAKAALPGTPSILGFFWNQGETEGSNVAAYATNLQAFVTAVRTDLTPSTTPFVIGRQFLGSYLSNNPRTIATAQATVSSGNALVPIVDTDDLVLNDYDAYHYSAASQLILGARQYAAALGPVNLFKQIGVATSAAVTSSTFTVKSIGSLAISITGGTYSKNGGALTSTSGTVANGDTIAFGHTASGTNETATTTVLTIGNATYTLVSETIPAVGAGTLDGTESDGSLIGWGESGSTDNIFLGYPEETGGGFGWSGSYATMSRNRAVSPDGAVNGVEIRASNYIDSSTAHSFSNLFFTVPNTYNSPAALSVYAKKSGMRYLKIVIEFGQGSGEYAWAYLDTQAGTITDSGVAGPTAGKAWGTPVVTLAKYGWYKFALPFTGPNDGQSYAQPAVYLCPTPVSTAAADSLNGGLIPKYQGDNQTGVRVWRPRVYR